MPRSHPPFDLYPPFRLSPLIHFFPPPCPPAVSLGRAAPELLEPGHQHRQQRAGPAEINGLDHHPGVEPRDPLRRENLRAGRGAVPERAALSGTSAPAWPPGASSAPQPHVRPERSVAQAQRKQARTWIWVRTTSGQQLNSVPNTPAFGAHVRRCRASRSARTGRCGYKQIRDRYATEQRCRYGADTRVAVSGADLRRTQRPRGMRCSAGYGHVTRPGHVTGMWSTLAGA
eukprot:3119856-Rhodomonas_salina.1